ncbi:MAG: TRAP transporter small permease [Oscillospiraceae bacterium]|nr:TRAP transporter small permease [Oscillospiraceae bacterium]
MKAYSKFMDVIEKIIRILLFVTVAVMVVVMIYQVILRYVFSASNSWSEELCRYLFIYSVMLGAAIAVRRNSHLQIDVLTSRFSPKLKNIVTIVATVAGIVFLGYLFIYSVELMKTGVKTASAGIPGVNMAMTYFAIPLGIVLMVLCSIEVILKNVHELRAGKE